VGRVRLELTTDELWKVRPGAPDALPARIPRRRADDGANCTVGTGGSVHEPVHADRGDHRMPATERYRRPADQRAPAPDGISPPGESQTLLTAEPLDLDSSTRSSGGYTRNVTKPPSSGPKCSERSGIETSSRSSRRRWYCTGSDRRQRAGRARQDLRLPGMRRGHQQLSCGSPSSTPAVDRYVAWSWVICRW
jgi:hypothetical protein